MASLSCFTRPGLEISAQGLYLICTLNITRPVEAGLFYKVFLSTFLPPPPKKNNSKIIEIYNKKNLKLSNFEILKESMSCLDQLLYLNNWPQNAEFVD